jgi:hypothetical protein
MAHALKDLMLSDKETLLQLIQDLRIKLKKKNLDLNRTRTKLNQARARMMKMKATVEFQRKRIIELY